MDVDGIESVRDGCEWEGEHDMRMRAREGREATDFKCPSQGPDLWVLSQSSLLSNVCRWVLSKDGAPCTQNKDGWWAQRLVANTGTHKQSRTTHACTRSRKRTRAQAHTRAHTQTHTRTHACMHGHMHALMEARTHACIHTSIHRHITHAHPHTHIHIHSHTHTHADTDTDTDTHTYAHTPTHRHTRTHACICAPTHAGMHAHAEHACSASHCAVLHHAQT
jgi:hypothetical protein